VDAAGPAVFGAAAVLELLPELHAAAATERMAPSASAGSILPARPVNLHLESIMVPLL
jgi:hypothetical protein